ALKSCSATTRSFHRFLRPRANEGTMNRKTLILGLAIFFGVLGSHAPAQDSPHHQHDHGSTAPQSTAPGKDRDGQMPGMQHDAPSSQPTSFIDEILGNETSGTSMEPNSVQVPMIMVEKGSWMLMFHGVFFLNFLQQSGPRGYDKIFSTNWFMPMAQRKLGPGQLTLRTMLSLEPATVTQRLYP